MPQWQKGQSGNPRGRPPGATPITDAIRKRLQKPKEIEALVDLIFQRAKTDNSSTALNLLVERTDGKVKEQLEVDVLSSDRYRVQMEATTEWIRLTHPELREEFAAVLLKAGSERPKASSASTPRSGPKKSSGSNATNGKRKRSTA